MFDDFTAAQNQQRRKFQPKRNFVSAQRVYDTLRFRLGCAPTDDYRSNCSYWMTPDGVSFRVDDPIADQGAANVLHNGRQQLFFSYEYARRLLTEVSDLIRTGPKRPPQPTPVCGIRALD